MLVLVFGTLKSVETLEMHVIDDCAHLAPVVLVQHAPRLAHTFSLVTHFFLE